MKRILLLSALAGAMDVTMWFAVGRLVDWIV